MCRFLLLLLSLFMILPLQAEEARVTRARQRVQTELGEHFGKQVFIRIIKEDYQLELWLQEGDGSWSILKVYDISAMSGEPGPKQAEGDEQAPEGFYRVVPGNMNPHSKFHLSFNIGYPNAYDRSLGRTGSFIMVHGGNESIGCFAMTDPCIEEIYTLVNEAFRKGSPYVPVQIYPFRMTPERMQQEAAHAHIAFWQHLLPGWQHTETKQEPFPDKDYR